MLWVQIPPRARCTTICDKVCQWLVAGRWFSPGTPVSSTNKTDRHDITKILLKVALSIIKPNQTKPIHLTILAPQLFVKCMNQAKRMINHVYMYVRVIESTSVSNILRLYLRTVLTVSCFYRYIIQYYFCLLFFLSVNIIASNNKKIQKMYKLFVPTLITFLLYYPSSREISLCSGNQADVYLQKYLK
jgi:hypothetical protein